MGRKYDPSRTPEFHWPAFADFCRYETLACGPDPHMALVGQLIKDCDLAERVWRVGCYLAVFNAPTAELIWQSWDLKSVTRDDGAALHSWLKEHWKGLHLRRERRPVKAPHKLIEHMLSYARWADDGFSRALVVKDYASLYDVVSEIRYVGRYATIKLSETLRRYCDVGPAIDDMRPRGGKHPRIGLAYLFPQYEAQLLGNDSPANCYLTNSLGVETQSILSEKYGVVLDHFHVEALLCDYKQSFHGRQYPGRSQDSELNHLAKVQAYWGEQFESEMLKARREIFPHWALGEIQGWDGVRDELTTILRDHGYTWSDSLYSYAATTDFREPVRKYEVVNAGG